MAQNRLQVLELAPVHQIVRGEIVAHSVRSQVFFDPCRDAVTAKRLIEGVGFALSSELVHERPRTLGCFLSGSKPLLYERYGVFVVNWYCPASRLALLWQYN